MEVVIQKSKKADKKFDAIIDGKKTIPFGSKMHSDFTLHKDEARKHRYMNRHEKRENWQDPKTAGFYSRWLLWNKSTLKSSVDDLNKRYKSINFILRN